MNGTEWIQKSQNEKLEAPDYGVVSHFMFLEVGHEGHEVCTKVTTLCSSCYTQSP